MGALSQGYNNESGARGPASSAAPQPDRPAKVKHIARALRHAQDRPFDRLGRALTSQKPQKSWDEAHFSPAKLMKLMVADVSARGRRS